MKNKEKEFADKFREEDKMLVIDEKRKKESLLLLGETISQKRIHIAYDKKQIFLNQIRYMDKSMLVIHMGICAILSLLILNFSRYGADKEAIIAFSMISSAALGIISIVEISRIFFSGIAELSESCYFNVKQIVACHMFIAGIINLTILSLGVLFVGIRWKMNLLQAGLYVLVPLVVTECCCLKVLLSEIGRKSLYPLVMVGAFLVVFYLVLASSPGLYEITALGIWGTAFFAGIVMLAWQIKNLFQRIEKGEIVCTN